mmetsp:Transcript_136508/g.345661  ORF Transcript_136508/g.345661 Transcript_136508/m.345661 type:complete len:428 (-) Transcript_136508:183-1466(-)
MSFLIVALALVAAQHSVMATCPLPEADQSQDAFERGETCASPGPHRLETGEDDMTAMLQDSRRAVRSHSQTPTARNGGLPKQYTCGLKEKSKLLLMVSSSGVRGPDIKASLDELVSALPAADGTANYAKLKLLEIYDPCMLKSSFWNEADDNFNAETGMNYVKAGIKNLRPDLVEYFDYAGPNEEMMDKSWCYNEWTNSSVTGGLKDLGFASHAQVSIMDHMMQSGEFEELVRADLGITGSASVKALMAKLQKRPVPSALKRLIEEADVFAMCGGNPDLAAFVMRAFPAVAKLLKKKLEKGRAVYMGRSAGGMVAGSNAAFSYEPTPEMFQSVLSADPTGLQLLPECIVKPHFKTEAHEVYASALEKGSGLRVARIPNYMALACKSGSCVLQGSPRPADLEWQNAKGHYYGHLDAVYDDLKGVKRRP